MSLCALPELKLTHRHDSPRDKELFLPVGCAEEQRGWHSPKSAPSIPEELMGYLCNRPVHPSQVYATLHSLYLPWFAGLCKLGKQAQSDSFSFWTGTDPLKAFQGGIRRLGTAGRKKGRSSLPEGKAPRAAQTEGAGEEREFLDTGKIIRAGVQLYKIFWIVGIRRKNWMISNKLPFFKLKQS